MENEVMEQEDVVLDDNQLLCILTGATKKITNYESNLQSVILMLNEEILTPDEDQDMSVSQETIMKVINDKRVAPKEYGWFMKKCMCRVNTAVYKQPECG